MQTDQLHAKHFEMLRLAKLRGLTAKRIGEGVYTVPSHTRRADGILWVVAFPTEGTPKLSCSCPAGKLPYCSHRATAVDHYFTVEASPADYSRYAGERTADRLTLNYRLRTNTTTRNDRIYFKACERYVREKRATAEEVKPTGLRNVRGREYAGSFQV